MKVLDVYKAIDRIAPFSAAMDFDNVGLLAGDGEQRVTKALICLDITAETVAEAIALGAELMVSHHPVIFHPLRAVEAGTAPSLLIRAGISAICCHTNLDICPEWGVNRALAEELGLTGPEPLADKPLLMGALPEPMEAPALAAYIKERLAGPVAFSAGCGGTISRVALCSGGGGEYIYGLGDGAQAFITGEARHDEWIEARRLGIPLFAAGHYETEKPFAPLLQRYLGQALPEAEFTVSLRETNPVLY